MPQMYVFDKMCLKTQVSVDSVYSLPVGSVDFSRLPSMIITEQAGQ